MEDKELAGKLKVVLKDIEEIMNKPKVHSEKIKEATDFLENQNEDLAKQVKKVINDF
tara:strand:+ start:133 stop:303 length:171 start_codon:yes stop_codon:yes gene_type:complete